MYEWVFLVLLSFRIPYQTLYTLLFSPMGATCSDHLIHRSNNISERVRVVKLLIIQISPASCYFVPLRSKCHVLSSAPCFRISSVCVLPLSVKNQVSYPYKITSNITILHILILKFLNDGRENKRF